MISQENACNYTFNGQMYKKKFENIDKIVTDKIGKWTVLTYTYEYKSQF